MILLTLILRRGPELDGLRMFELHKTHELHVHMLANEQVQVEDGTPHANDLLLF